MANIKAFLTLTVVYIQAILVAGTPLRIGSFNLQVFGTSKASEDSTMSIYSRVSRHIATHCRVCVLV